MKNIHNCTDKKWKRKKELFVFPKVQGHILCCLDDTLSFIYWFHETIDRLMVNCVTLMIQYQITLWLLVFSVQSDWKRTCPRFFRKFSIYFAYHPTIACFCSLTSNKMNVPDLNSHLFLPEVAFYSFSTFCPPLQLPHAFFISLHMVHATYIL